MSSILAKSISRILIGTLCLLQSVSPLHGDESRPPVLESKVVVLPGRHAIQFHINGQEPIISWSDNSRSHRLVGRKASEEKVKYELDQSGVIAEVKEMGREEFKLRTPQGELIWKLKFSAKKIKIMGSDTNAVAIEIDGQSANGFRVHQGGKLLGHVEWFPAQKISRVADADGNPVFEKEAPQPERCLGVLLLPGVPDWQRYILLAESLERSP
jgi:hypothetical protein